MSLAATDALFNSLLAAIGLGLWILRGRRRVVGATHVLAAILVAGLLLAGMLSAGRTFLGLRLLCWLAFTHVPAHLLVTAVILRHRRRVAAVALTLMLCIVAVGIDAFFVEPHFLEVTHTTITSDKLTGRLRIVVVADIQTEHIGDYERDTLQRALALEPDLLLFAGDYIQTTRRLRAQREQELTDLLRTLDIKVPAIAVQGDMELNHWQRIFAGTSIKTSHAGEMYAFDDFSVTALNREDSPYTRLRVPPAPGFHIVLGHRPDFALGDINADLLIAGHTHGGQVRLPVIGPLMTLSRVPRDWAAGLTRLPSGAHLYVSRGIGMERNDAPRLRFLCRPELAVIDVVPAATPPPDTRR